MTATARSFDGTDVGGGVTAIDALNITSATPVIAYMVGNRTYVWKIT